MVAKAGMTFSGFSKRTPSRTKATQESASKYHFRGGSSWRENKGIL